MSLLALFLSLWLATMPVAFMFSVGCCCTTPCTGSGSGDCCTSTMPAQIDVTIPADFSNIGGAGTCSACNSIGGTTYTLTGSVVELACGGFGAGSGGAVDYEYGYRASSFCTGVSSGICGTLDFDLLLFAVILCNSSECKLTVGIALTPTPPVGCCCNYRWIYRVSFSSGTDCDTEVWSVPFVSMEISNGACGTEYCTTAASPADLSVQKT